MLSLAQKIKIIENLPECGSGIRAEARTAQEELAREKMRHRVEMQAIVERFERDAWHWVERRWTEEEIEAARTLGR